MTEHNQCCTGARNLRGAKKSNVSLETKETVKDDSKNTNKENDMQYENMFGNFIWSNARRNEQYTPVKLVFRKC